MLTKGGLLPLTITPAASLVNLEPPGARRVEFVTCAVTTGRHVGEHRAGIVRPL